MNEHKYKLTQQSGLSLVELMIAMAISIVIVAAMSELFVNLSRSNTEMAKTNSQIENARFAMQFLENDIVHAGYWGGFVPVWDDFSVIVAATDVPAFKPDPCLAFGSWTQAYKDAAIGVPLEVYGTPPASCIGGLLGGLGHIQPNSDIVVVRHADTCVAGDAGCDAVEANALYFEINNCDGANEPGVYQLDPNDPLAPDFAEVDCLTDAGRRRYVQNIYYVRDHAITHGDGIPTLMRSTFGVDSGTPTQLAADALVEGVERLRVELGFDRESHLGGAVNNASAIVWANEDVRLIPTNRGNGAAEGEFERCLSEVGACTVADLMNVVGAKIYILARANEATAGYTDTKTYSMGSATGIGPFNDSFKRHVFSTTVRLNNVSGRRDTPYDPNSP